MERILKEIPAANKNRVTICNSENQPNWYNEKNPIDENHNEKP